MDLPSTLVVFFVGAVFGSFGGVLVDRLPYGKSLLGRSYCTACNKTLQCIDLIPLLSFLFLFGRCRQCKAPIPWTLFTVEVLSGLLFVFSFSLMLEIIPLLTFTFALWFLLLLAVCDIHTQTVPDLLSFPFVIIAAVFSLINGTVSWSPIIVGGFFLLQWLVSRGRWVGSGDIIIGTGIGFLFWDSLGGVMAIGASYIIGAVIAGGLILIGKKTREDRIAFVPFLGLGTVAALIIRLDMIPL